MKKVILLTTLLTYLHIFSAFGGLNVGATINKETIYTIDKHDRETTYIELEQDEEMAMNAEYSDEEISYMEKPVKAQDKQPETYSKFDFIAGHEIIFFDDFNDDPIGDFPAKWNTNNTGEVVMLEGIVGKWFQLAAEGGNYFPELNLQFPENVTIEFDLIINDNFEFGFTYYSEENFDVDAYGVPGDIGLEFTIDNSLNHSFRNYCNNSECIEINTNSAKGELIQNKVNHISIWIQKTRFRLYIGKDKVFDIPKGVFTSQTYNRLRLFTFSSGSNIFISNVRIAVGATDTRKQLISEGKLITRGILFDVNSDKIKPESYGCIKEIASVLKENPTINVLIIGHTDSDGDEAMNLKLSKLRAISVKNYLVNEFGIDALRLSTDGKGESEPVEINNSSANKAQNRRVEFIKK